MKKKVQIIRGGDHEDVRGKLTFFNEFDMKSVRRFYLIEHPDTKVVRAWQAHKIEQKWFHVLKGSFKLILVQPNDWTTPSPDLSFQKFILKKGDNKIIHVPGGFASGFQAVEPDSELLVFSDFAMADAGTDDYRFDKNLWYQWE
ncbi:MAG: hypothetical protein ABIP35_01055 [Ginsengibacter sp.]